MNNFTTDTRRPNIATIEAPVYRAATLCQAPESDIHRRVITGIHIDVEHGIVAATNGHIMYTGPVEDHNDTGNESVTFRAPKIPANATDVLIQRMGPDTVAIHVYKEATVLATHMAEVIDIQYPAYRNVMANPENNQEPFTMFSFDAKYLAMLKQIFGIGALSFAMASNSKPARIHASDGRRPGEITLMPCRCTVGGK